MNLRLTEQQRRDICHRYCKGDLVDVILRDFGISLATLYRVINAANVAHRNPSASRAPEEAAQIVADYRAKKPYTKIEREYHVSANTIVKLVRQAGHEPRGYRREVPTMDKLLMTDAQILHSPGTHVAVDHVLPISEQRNRDVALQVAKSLALGAKVLDEPVEQYAAARREAGIR